MATKQAAPASTDATPAQLLQKHFGFSEFRPGQERVIDALDAHRAALAVFPTGPASHCAISSRPCVTRG